MAFKPWTEITNWARSEGYTTKDVTRYLWWNFAKTIHNEGVEAILNRLALEDGKIGIPISMMPHYVNSVFNGNPVEEYLTDSFKDDFRDFVKNHPTEPSDS